MSASGYFKKGAAKEFAKFFGDSKRLKLLEQITPAVSSLHTRLQRPLNILDIGAGTGMHAAYLAQMGHKVTALDPVAEMLAEGQKLYQHPNLEFVVDSLPQLSQVKNRKFDAIYSIAAWQYIKPADRLAAISSVAQLLVPGGFFSIVWPVPMSREFQFPLTHADLCRDIDAVNAKFPEEQRIQLSLGNPVIDPDGRMGFEEKSQPVYFHTTLGCLPAPQPENELERTHKRKL